MTALTAKESEVAGTADVSLDFVVDVEELVKFLSTPQRRKILEYLAAGLQVNDVAAKLILSPNTIKNHIAVMRSATHIRTIAGLVAFAIRQGVIE